MYFKKAAFHGVSQGWGMSSKVLSRKLQKSQEGPGMYFKPIINSFKPLFGCLFEVAGRATGREGEVRDDSGLRNPTLESTWPKISYSNTWN